MIVYFAMVACSAMVAISKLCLLLWGKNSLIRVKLHQVSTSETVKSVGYNFLTSAIQFLC